MERLEISVSDKQLTKGIEEDGADGYEAEAPDEDWLSELIDIYHLTLTLWPLDFGVLRVYFSVF